jgi:iron(III) transport system ATP-binding protein
VTALELRDLRRLFDGHTALDGIDLAVAHGETIVVLGPSGSGKTTLLRLVAGLDRPDGGVIELDGRVVSGPGVLVEPHRRGIGFVFQSPALWPHMTVEQNVGYGLARVPGDERRERVGRVLGDLEIADLARRYPDQISGGQARRVALARAVAPAPRLLLMDEPLSHLDEELRRRLVPVLRRVARDTTLLYVTHDPWEAEALGGRVVRLAEGKLVES